ncbi:MAG: hypothetical protein UU24_C0029G0005 [Candidatus Nomurabacteria bacterium GW2011_GWA2_40_9]|uniref:Uncharacterized protein n=1 Tax=Candidatus Nomurabacteria bacterium GW2011_GWA2_40_9 TaxID=1618734 RepID=A0A0G0TNS1_9BACT|nr:MAG: hypothetical protein UU24_C0029G0005 [Candidatus Nomurabacteria bacterium GW2011_GWA2_40_9]
MIRNPPQIIQKLNFDHFYHRFNLEFLQLLICKIKKDNFLIADYGGGD